MYMYLHSDKQQTFYKLQMKDQMEYTSQKLNVWHLFLFVLHAKHINKANCFFAVCWYIKEMLVSIYNLTIVDWQKWMSRNVR